MNVQQRDVQWLGEEEAHLGPAARAALGILLERGDWSWWNQPSDTASALELAVGANTPVAWGGGESVVQAVDWVDARRASELGRAFIDMKSAGLFSDVRISRWVWSWQVGSNQLASAFKELSELFGPGHVFPEWEQDINPRFPTSQLAQGGKRVLTSPSLSRDVLMPTEHDGIEWADQINVPDIVVADLDNPLSRVVAAKLVILYGQDLSAVLPRTFDLRQDLAAQCAIYVEDDGERMAPWLDAFLTAWGKGNSISMAVQDAALGTGLLTQVLSTTKTFFFHKRTFRRKPTKPGSSGAASGTTDGSKGPIADAARRTRVEPTRIVEAAATPMEEVAEAVAFHAIGSDSIAFEPAPVSLPGPPIERVLVARAQQRLRELRVWPTSGSVKIHVDIRSKTPVHANSPSFPDELIEWEGDEKTLQLHLFELGRKPITQPLKVRRMGRSQIATFEREADDRPVDLRLLVSDGARIVQTARFQTAPGQAINFFVESIVTPIARAKSEFDVALLVNDSLGGKPSVTVITDNGQSHFSPLTEGQTKTARDLVLDILDKAVADPTAPLDPLMVELACAGASLLQCLRDSVPEWPGNVGRLQLVTQSDAFFPIEYLYEGEVPESRAAKLCPERAGCLLAGEAIPRCAIRTACEYLCPMGFLGVSGVVERHAWEKGKNARVWTPPDLHRQQRRRIDDLSKIAFAASNKADGFRDEDVGAHEIVRIAQIEESLGVDRIASWSDWKDDIQSNSPSLLLLILHVDRQAVYVGDNASLNLVSLNAKHVGDASVVVAIGCNTGAGDLPGTSLPAMFQRGGAEVVIAAMTGMLGRHANRVARDLTLRIRSAASSPRSRYVGELVSELRRQLLAEGLALGLSVVAFGDADVVLGIA